MNIMELQENFEYACLYYASKFSPVKSLDNLFEANYVENKNKKKGHPNYYKMVTKWNHDSPAPNDSDLLNFKLSDVKKFYESVKDSLEDIKMLPVFFNSKTRKFQILVNNQWSDL